VTREAIAGLGTVLGDALHTLPFLISVYVVAVAVAACVVAFRLLLLASLRRRFLTTGLVQSLGGMTLGGAMIAAVSVVIRSVA
jgi:hypothetical protein